ncbi:MAG: hypothetical protein HKN14_07290 [Marinicaulis sp.]|nr:hypothetical protein [Marinicaulis sp.]
METKMSYEVNSTFNAYPRLNEHAPPFKSKNPENKLLARLYYPMMNGRSVDEILRLVDALQITDEHGVATPECWVPGDQVILPTPATAEEAKSRVEGEYDCTDWYFCKKELAA